MQYVTYALMLFPVYAGVILVTNQNVPRESSFPRVCGALLDIVSLDYPVRPVGTLFMIIHKVKSISFRDGF